MRVFMISVIFQFNFVFATEPFALIKGPSQAETGSEILLNFTGSVSEGEPDVGVALAPTGSSVQVTPLYTREQHLLYGVAIPDKPGLYRFVVVAIGDTFVDRFNKKRVYAFHDVTVKDVSKQIKEPDTPQPPLIDEFSDQYGFKAFVKNIMSMFPKNDFVDHDSLKIAEVFDIMCNKHDQFSNPTDFVRETSDQYKKVLGEHYGYWKYYLFDPVKNRLVTMNQTEGKLPSTVEAHVQVWREIVSALKEGKK